MYARARAYNRLSRYETLAISVRRDSRASSLWRRWIGWACARAGVTIQWVYPAEPHSAALVPARSPSIALAVKHAARSFAGVRSRVGYGT